MALTNAMRFSVYGRTIHNLVRPSPHSSLRGVFAGTGHFAEIQLASWEAIEGVQVIGLAGPDDERRHRLATRHAIPETAPDLASLLARVEPDFVDICTSLDSHAELVRTCLARRIPVLCQKPLAPTLAEARSLVEAAERAGVALMVHDNWRWQPWYRELRRLLAAGAVGRPLSVYHTLRTGDGAGPEPYPGQPYFRSMRQFLLLETGIHYFDTYRFLFGEPARVSALLRRNNPAIAGEDQAVVTLDFPAGPLVTWDADRTAPVRHVRPPVNGTLRLEGTAGTLELDEFGTLTRTAPDGTRFRHTYPIPSGYRGGSVTATLAHFAHGLRTGATFETTGADYLKTMEVVFAAYSAAEAGRTVAVP
jgi:predicted dehydrogenase